MKRIVLIAMAIIIVTAPAWTAVDQKIQIQGVLKDSNGTVMPDGDYSVHLQVFDAPSGGLSMWEEDTEIIQDNGVFTAMMHGLYPNTFDRDTWLEITFEGEAPMAPRTPIIPVPVALCASTVDPDAAVVRLNGKKGSVSLIGGTNVTIVPSTQGDEITIHASAGTGMDDGDWTQVSGNLFHDGAGTVAIGTDDPTPLYASIFGTTMQINAATTPALCLDRTLGGFDRWAMYRSGGGLRLGRTEDESAFPVSGIEINDTKTHFRDENGDTGITLQTYDSMEAGSVIYMYGTATATPTLTLDAQIGTGGGNIVVRDGAGNAEVTITGNHYETGVGRITTPVLEITGGSDLSEQFDVGNGIRLIEPGMVVRIDPDNPGQLTLSDSSYDRRVAGVVSGAGGVNTGMVMGQKGTVADGELPVALVGRVYVRADASGGPIEPGDLLTTSDRPGHAMKVTDHDRATGAILGKAMTGLDEGQGLILVLVTLL